MGFSTVQVCGLFLALDLGIKILDTLKLFTSSILS